MISETMPLNEWPVIMLKSLKLDLEAQLRTQQNNEGSKSLSTLMVWDVVNTALKDAQEKENQLPFK